MKWVDELAVRTSGSWQTLFLQFPDYRPDLMEKLSRELGLSFFDFRKEVMSFYGADAHRVTLTMLDTAIEKRGDEGWLIFNVDAVLITKSQDEVSAWFDRLAQHPWRRVLIPLTLYQVPIMTVPLNVITVDRSEVPEHGLLHRLLEVKTEPESRSGREMCGEAKARS